jgi:transcriptional regulator with XRE-family HTH domain
MALSRYRLRRLLYDLTLDDVSAASGVDPSLLSRIERGIVPGSPELHAKIQAALENAPPPADLGRDLRLAHEEVLRIQESLRIGRRAARRAK